MATCMGATRQYTDIGLSGSSFGHFGDVVAQHVNIIIQDSGKGLLKMICDALKVEIANYLTQSVEQDPRRPKGRSRRKKLNAAHPVFNPSLSGKTGKSKSEKRPSMKKSTQPLRRSKAWVPQIKDLSDSRVGLRMIGAIDQYIHNWNMVADECKRWDLSTVHRVSDPYSTDFEAVQAITEEMSGFVLLALLRRMWLHLHEDRHDRVAAIVRNCREFLGPNHPLTVICYLYLYEQAYTQKFVPSPWWAAAKVYIGERVLQAVRGGSSFHDEGSGNVIAETVMCYSMLLYPSKYTIPFLKATLEGNIAFFSAAYSEVEGPAIHARSLLAVVLEAAGDRAGAAHMYQQIHEKIPLVSGSKSLHYKVIGTRRTEAIQQTHHCVQSLGTPSNPSPELWLECDVRSQVQLPQNIRNMHSDMIMSKYGKDHELYRRINEYRAQRNFQPSEFQRPEVRSTSVYTFSACKQTQYSFNLYNKGDLDYNVNSEEPRDFLDHDPFAVQLDSDVEAQIP